MSGFVLILVYGAGLDGKAIAGLSVMSRARRPRNFDNGSGVASTKFIGEAYPGSSKEAVSHLRDALGQGICWQRALVEAMGLWTAREEVVGGRHYRYLIQNEAFNWPLLGSRLLQEMRSIVTVDQQTLVSSILVELPRSVVRKSFGVEKYRAFLNYWYGVIVEQAIQRAVDDEIRKERVGRGLSADYSPSDESYVRIYDEGKDVLLEKYRNLGIDTNLEETTEFTYWLFKLRLENSAKERIGSDTRKGLDWLTDHPKAIYTATHNQR